MISYRDFMQSYLEELDPSRKIIEEIEEATDKSKVYKENFIFRDNLQSKKITPVLKTGEGRDKLVDFTAEFIDSNATALAKSGPIMMIRFTDNDCNKLYDMFNTSKDEVMTLFNQVIQDTYYGKLSKPLQGLVERAPHKLVVVGALIDAVQNNYTDIVECMEYLLPLIDYPMLFSHYWPTGVKEEVMEYTVEHLPNKFKLKKVSNLQGLLRWDGKSAIDYFKDKITDGQDHWYADVIYSMRSRLNNTFKNISSMYYKNSESGKTQHKNITQYDDGSIADTNEGMSTIAAQVIDNTISKFASGTINLNIVKRCAEAMQVDRGNLEGFINQIYGDRTSQIPKFIEYTISAYFNKYPTSTRIQASEFVPFGLSLYRSIATSKETMLKNIKDIVNHWMYEIIHIDQLYNREGTKSVYTRAVFNYFILMINYYNLL